VSSARAAKRRSAIGTKAVSSFASALAVLAGFAAVAVAVAVAVAAAAAAAAAASPRAGCESRPLAVVGAALFEFRHRFALHALAFGAVLLTLGSDLRGGARRHCSRACLT
jgi:hypothetical protein